MLTTMVGRANGRSISALTTRFPGKSSRTSTQAMRVPITALINATTIETITVMRRVASAPGVVTAVTNPAIPSANA